MMGALTTCGLLLSYISGTARRLSILFSYPNGQLKEPREGVKGGGAL